ncbi:hypothetical protein F8388_001230 [Cannabis sativa]|uniref:Reverse transcriptase zinc-binding domain-containing protein n=1 Tax=Cannabis sativa TaxID=3483 RepID=A0A7J6GGR3_CANSA|nr:hypothetical protein F8388_001230 [Cannabis sativa]
MKVDYAGAVLDNLMVPKHKIYFCQVINEHLLVRDFLSRIINTQVELCPVCDQGTETHDHFFATVPSQSRWELKLTSGWGPFVGLALWLRYIAGDVAGMMISKTE